MSIRIRFILLIGILSLIAIIGTGVASYKFSVNNAVAEAKAKGSLVFTFLEASRAHFRDKQRPKIEELLDTLAPDSEEVPVDLISGFALTRGVWDQFVQKESDYHFKQATVDPLVLSNKADETDMEIIKRFQASPKTKDLEGSIIKGGKAFYYYAEQIPVVQGCLKCHGEPEKAPAWQRTQYGIEHGYNWKVGDIASAYVVYIPMQRAIDQAKRDAFQLIALGTGTVLILMFVIWLFFSSYVIKPINMLEKRATEISLGKNLSEPIATPTQDEIGTLGRAVDRLRISVEKMLSRFK